MKTGVSLIAVALILAAGLAQADYGLKGYVYTRGVVEGEDGSQYWAEYNAATGLLEGHFPAADSYAVDSTLLMSALQYRVYVERWEDIKQEYKDAELLADPQSSGEEHPPLNLSRAELLQTQFTILSGEGETPQTFQFNEDDLQEDTRHIILRPPVNKGAWEYLPLFNNDDQLDTNAVKRHIVLAQMPINPDETIAGASLSLLVSTSEDNMSKRVLKESEHNIGFLTSFVGGVEGAEEYDGKSLLELKYGAIRNDETEFTNPIDGAIISTFGGMGYEFFDVTDEEGKYSIFFAGWLGGPPCWIMVDMYSPITIKMQSKSFNPRLKQGYPYYILAPHYLPCNPAHPLTYLRATSVAASGGGLSGAMAGVNMIAMAATSSTLILRQDYIVDMKVLAGQAEMSNEHLSRDASIDPNKIIDRSSDVLDPDTQDEWAALGWTKEIEVGDSTRYRVDDPQDKDYKIIQNRYDFDGDGVEDTTKIGQFMCVTPAPEDGGQDTERLVDRITECNEGEERDFKINETASNENKIAKQDVDAAKNASPPTPYYQAVYFSGGEEEDAAQPVEGLPDIIRLLDDVINDYHQGLVEFISKDDLRNTDIYVFRESTGDLLAERSGLANRDLENTGGTDETDLGAETDEDDNKTRFFYRLQMRGGLDGHLRVGNRFGRQSGENNDEAFERWQTNSGMNPKFHERQADHIRPGEPVKVIAINRATGYIGTAKTTLNVKDSIYTVPSIVVPRIKMGPPNLKIWAERELKVEYGLTKGEKREYLIGSEGAAETDDIIIKVYTEWLDQDGSPLPAQLKDFGYTARLGKLNSAGIIENYLVTLDADDTASTSGQSVRYFPINPGKNLQLVRVSEANAGTQHLYVQVNGESYIRNPDFSGDPDINIELNQSDNHTGEGANFDELGAGDAQLETRPKRYVPLLTPVWDEDSTLENELYFRQWEIAQEEEQANGGSPSDVNPFKPEPAYKWRYRPEYHFTVYDLNVSKIERTYTDSNEQTQTQNILNLTDPIIASTDDLISFIYTLAEQVAEPISLFSGEIKELVFAMGEEEFTVSFGTDQTIKIENIAHLSSLESDDFLSLRLYTNNDASNPIWEYAFEHIYIGTQHDNYDPGASRLYVSADAETIPLQALVVGYANRDESIKEPLTGIWQVTGDSAAYLTVTTETDEDVGVFFNELKLPFSPRKGAVANVSFKLGDQNESLARLQPIEILAGAPAQIDIQKTDGTYTSAGGFGTVDLTITVRDQFGNLVEDGTAVDIIMDAEGFVEPFDTSQEIFEGLTENGVVQARLRGGYTPGDYPIQIVSGKHSETISYTVHPLDVNILTSLTEIAPQSSTGVQIEVLDHLGNPVQGADVRVWGKGFVVDDSNAVTDASGIATARVVAGAVISADASLKAQVAFEPATERTFEIKPRADQDRFQGRSDNIIIVGDKVDPGTVEYVRYDEAGFNVPYVVSSETTYTGTAGETLDLELGDLTEPNLDPVSTYFLREKIIEYNDDTGESFELTPDEAGVLNLRLENVEVAQNNSPNNNLSSSGYFDGNSRVIIENAARFTPASPGLTLSFNSNFFSDGTLIENGPLRVDYINEQVRVTVTTDIDTYVLETGNVVAGTWHKLGLKLVNSELHLQVNEEIFTLANIQGNFVNTTSPGIGEGFEGYITHVGFYDYAQAPLVTFEDGSTSKSLSFTADNLTQTVTVKSAGNLNQASGGSTRQRTVKLNSLTQGQLAIAINLLSTEFYTEIAGHYLVTLYKGEEVPDINLAAIENPNLYASPLNQLGLFPKAYALSWSDIGSGFVSALSTAVSFLLPIYEIKAIYEQIGYLVADDPNFDPVILAINTVGILTYIPGIGYLAKPIYKPVKALFTLGRAKPKAMLAVGGTIMKLVTRVKKSKSLDPVLSLLPFLLVAAEMYYTSPEAISIMFDSIQSDDDLWAWIDYFNIPDDWNEDDEGVPELELSTDYSNGNGNLGSVNSIANISPMFLPKAHALPKARMKGGPFANALRQAVSKLPPGFDKHALTQALKSTKQLSDSYFKSLRRVVKDPKFLASTTALAIKNGQKNLQKFLSGASDARISPILFLSMVAFLEDEALKGRLRPELYKEVATLYAKVMSAVAYRKPTGKSTLIEFKEENTGTSDEDVCEKTALYIPQVTDAIEVLNAGGHGAMFHLAMVAYYHLITKSEYVTANPKYEIKALEASRRIWIYNNAEQVKTMANAPVSGTLEGSKKPIANTLRRVDIVLAEAGKINKFDPEIWIELKSYRASARDPGRYKTRMEGFNTWNLGSGDNQTAKQCRNSSLHKQFVHDRVAQRHGVHSTKSESDSNSYEPIRVLGIKWWFQQFKVNVESKNPKKLVRVDQSPKLGSYSQNDQIRGNLTEIPKGKADTVNLNLFGVSSNVNLNAQYKSTGAAKGSYQNDDVIEEASIKNLVVETMFTSGLLPGGPEIKQLIIDSMLDPDN